MVHFIHMFGLIWFISWCLVTIRLASDYCRDPSRENARWFLAFLPFGLPLVVLGPLRLFGLIYRAVGDAKLTLKSGERQIESGQLSVIESRSRAIRR